MKLQTLALLVLSVFASPATGQGTAALYPSESLKAGEEGTAAFHVDVTPDGRAENCQILQTSGFKRLDDATCAVVTKHARFNPKLDDRGRPVRGDYSGKLHWVLPKR